MGDHLRIRPDRTIVPLLATAVVLLGGVSSCIAIILAFGEAKPVPVAIAVGCGLGFGVIVWLLRDRPQARQRSMFAWMLQRNRNAEHAVYKLAVIQRRTAEYGSNQPPTLEQLRELKDATRTWVPTKGRVERAPDDPGPSP